MDRSASIRVDPEPCRSGDIEIPAGSQWNIGEFLAQTLSVALAAFKLRLSDRTVFAGRARGPCVARWASLCNGPDARRARGHVLVKRRVHALVVCLGRTLTLSLSVMAG
jgi:hypothetical protein